MRPQQVQSHSQPSSMCFLYVGEGVHSSCHGGVFRKTRKRGTELSQMVVLRSGLDNVEHNQTRTTWPGAIKMARLVCTVEAVKE